MIHRKRKDPRALIIGLFLGFTFTGILHYFDLTDSFMAFTSELNFFQGFLLYALIFGSISLIFYGLNYLYVQSKPENVKAKNLEKFENIIDGLKTKFRSYSNSQKIKFILIQTEKMILNSEQIARLLSYIDEDEDRFQLIKLFVKRGVEMVDHDLILEKISFKKNKTVVKEYLENL